MGAMLMQIRPTLSVCDPSCPFHAQAGGSGSVSHSGLSMIVNGELITQSSSSATVIGAHLGCPRTDDAGHDDRISSGTFSTSVN